MTSYKMMDSSTPPLDSSSFRLLPVELKRHILLLTLEDSLDALISRRSTDVRFTIAHLSREWRATAFNDLKLFSAVQVHDEADAVALVKLLETREGEQYAGEEDNKSPGSTSPHLSPQLQSSAAELAQGIKTLHVGTDYADPSTADLFFADSFHFEDFDMTSLVGACPFVEEISLVGVRVDGDWLGSAYLRRLHVFASALIPNGLFPRNDSLQHITITDSAIGENLQYWMSPSHLPNVTSLIFERNDQPGDLELAPGLVLAPTVEPCPLTYLRHTFIHQITKLSLTDVGNSFAPSPKLKWLACPDDLVFHQMLDRLPLSLQHLKLKRTDGLQPPLDASQSVTLIIAALGRLQKLQTLEVSFGWSLVSEYETLQGRCDEMEVVLCLGEGGAAAAA